MDNPTDIKAWCADPRQFIELVTSKKLDSLSYMIHSYGISIDAYSGPKLPFYINIFSGNNPLVRLYFYQLDSEIKVSIDSLKKYDSPSEIITQLKKIAAEAQITVEISSRDVAYARTRRYFPISKNDYETIKNCSTDLISANWLDSGMYNYGRNSRLDIMLNQIHLYTR